MFNEYLSSVVFTEPDLEMKINTDQESDLIKACIFFMGPENYIKLSELNHKIYQTITDRFTGQTFWVVADITNHSYKADKKIHYFELVEKGTNTNSITAKILGKAWGAGSMHLSDFEKNNKEKCQ